MCLKVEFQVSSAVIESDDKKRLTCIDPEGNTRRRNILSLFSSAELNQIIHLL